MGRVDGVLFAEFGRRCEIAWRCSEATRTLKIPNSLFESLLVDRNNTFRPYTLDSMNFAIYIGQNC